MNEKANIQNCLKVCKRFIKKKNLSEPAKEVFREYEKALGDHLALMDGIEVDQVFPVFDRLKENAIVRFEAFKRLGYRPVPILIKGKDNRDVYEALELIEQVLKESIQNHMIYYYSLSLQLPKQLIAHWTHPVLYRIAESEEEAKRMASESMELVEKERRMKA